MSLLDPDDIGVAYFDREGKELHFGGGMRTVEDAAARAQDELNRGIYDRAVEARIYRGRTWEQGEVLEVVWQGGRSHRYVNS